LFVLFDCSAAGCVAALLSYVLSIRLLCCELEVAGYAGPIAN
jgi:hypothetical protein